MLWLRHMADIINDLWMVGGVSGSRQLRGISRWGAGEVDRAMGEEGAVEAAGPRCGETM